MARRKTKDDNSVGMTVARGLAALAYGKRFDLNIAHDVEATFAALVRAVELVDELQKRVETLEREKSVRPKLRAA